ncbi:hypothetical protein MSAN_00213400 [Mycena sanguinolenta]|uniref:F-box domain-containing protein n=1 Tax=Mycena sanguinolenta TaxID=230812 RepID=A0A8H6ZHI9_9AGAR|nr:hypothetical protein MSAN_00213400 [Mycena sanguinolenta]
MSLSELPTELTRTIAGHLELRDQLVLCRTNSRMQAICVQWIYRILILDDLVQFIRCCETIIGRPEAALSVWELKSHCLPSYALKSFYTTLRSATTKMENLRVITIDSLHLFRSIADVVFPQLTDCNIPLLLDSADSYSFLRRNPTIESIVIITIQSGQFISNNIYHIQPVHMPKLRRFVGPEIAACAVVPGSPLSTLTILWGPRPAMGYSRGLTAAASSTADLCELNHIITSWDPVLLQAIAEYTPRIECLNIQGFSLPGTPEKEDFLSAMDTTLRSLTCLAQLIVSDNTIFDRIADVLEAEFNRVRRWGDICPTLERVCLSGPWARWEGLWLPGKCCTNEPESIECLKWLIKKIVTSPELPSLYRTLGNAFAGVVGMKVLEEAVKRGEAVPAFDILRTEGGDTVISFPSDP